MRATRIALLALVLSGALAAVGSAATSIAADVHIGPSGRAAVDLGLFYDDLAPYGHWVQSASYGWVWSPRVTRAHWRPYLYGHWAWTDWGWTWVSDEPYGWACYHYGRWVDDSDYGWEWIPGDQWGPSWVSWRASDDYVGWAPLPPGGFDVSVASADFVFVPERQFLAPRVANFITPFDQVNGIFPRTRSFTNYQISNNRVFNAGVPVDRIQQAIGRPVPRFQVADQSFAQRHQTRIAQNRVAMFRPQVQKARNVAPPPARPLARRSVLTAAAAAPLRANRAARNQQIANQQRVAQQAQVLRQNRLQNHGQQIASQRRFGQQGQAMSQNRLQNHGQQIASQRRFGQQGQAMRQNRLQNHGQQIASQRRSGQQGQAMRQNRLQNHGQQIANQRRLGQQGRQQAHQQAQVMRQNRPQQNRVQQIRQERQVQRQRPQPQRMAMAQPRPQREMRPRFQQGGPQRMAQPRPQRQGPPPQRMMAQQRPQRQQANPNRGGGGPQGQRPNRNRPPGR